MNHNAIINSGLSKRIQINKLTNIVPLFRISKDKWIKSFFGKVLKTIIKTTKFFFKMVLKSFQ